MLLADTGVVWMEVAVPIFVSEVVRESVDEDEVEIAILVVTVVLIAIEEGLDETRTDVSVSVIDS